MRRPRPPVDVLWCANHRSVRVNGWAFPPTVERHLKAMTTSKRVLQLFGGLSKWGVKLDVDPFTRPHVIGDAWLPPFRKDAFDVVILDPPYLNLNQQMRQQLLRAASWVASEHLLWFHTLWIAGDARLALERAWLVRVGDSCAVRCLQVFKVPTDKPKPRSVFTRGPAIKYNRWLVQPERLPLEYSA